MTREELRDQVDTAGLAAYWPGLEPLIRPALSIRTRRAESDLPVGLSKFGGEPDLPEDAVWPVTAGEKPLRFLGQIDLEEVAPLLPPEGDGLPPAGLLSFFYHDQFYTGEDTDPDVHGWHVPAVLYTPASRTIRRAASPAVTFPTAHLSFQPVLTPPDEPQAASVFGGDEAANGRYTELIWGAIETLDFDRHRLLGAMLYQGDAAVGEEMQAQRHGLLYGGGVPEPGGYTTPREACEAAGVAEGIDDWRLLAYFAYDETLEWYWGKGGSLYFFILGADLAARDFSHVQAVNHFV